MILRDYQETLVSRSLECLLKFDGVIAIAGTGAGKTVCLSAVAAAFKRVLVLQHRNELLEQNSNTFSWVNPSLWFSLACAEEKNFDAPYVFGMTQTLARCLDDIPSYDLIIVDECHHTVANQHASIIEAVRKKNPKCKLFGVTATPERADKKDMSKFYQVISDRVKMDYLIERGYLVPPIGYRIEVADQKAIERNSDNDEYIEELLNVKATNQRVIEEWNRKAKGRQTVVFCQTRNHALDVCAAFCDAGIKADFIDGSMPNNIRKRKLKAFDSGKINVMVNVNVLTEGFDSQPVACIIILRGNSSKSALIQIVGRGLRRVDVSRYPNVFKKDCIVLDFGVSLLKHGNLESGERLCFDNYVDTEDAVRQCDACGYPLELEEKICGFCGHTIDYDSPGTDTNKKDNSIGRFVMTEIELFKRSSFHWEEFGDNGHISHGWNAYAIVYLYEDVYYTIAAAHRKHAKLISASTNKLESLITGEDFLSQNGDPEMSGKHQQWIKEPATRSQRNLLPTAYQKMPLTKHQASCMLVLTSNDRWKRINKLMKTHYETIGYQYSL